MEKKSDKKVFRWEEPGQYWIEADTVKNRIIFNLHGPLRKGSDIPKYVEHTKAATEVLKEGFTVMAYGYEVKRPGFTTTKPFKEGHLIMKAKNCSKMAPVVRSPVQKMMVGVLGKLTGTKMKVFYDPDEAKAWLDEKD